MFSHTHLISGILFGLLGLEFNLIDFIDIISISFITVFMDIDHYIIYFFQKKNFSLKNFLNTVAQDHGGHHYRSFIHRAKFILLMATLTMLLAFFNTRFAYIIASAYFSHIALDIISSNKSRINHYKPLRIANITIMWSKLENMIFLFLLTLSLIIVIL